MRRFFAGFQSFTGFLIITAAFTFNAFAQSYTNKPTAAKTTAAEENVGAARQSDTAADYKNEFAVWGAVAPDIPRLFSGSRKSTFGEIGVRYSRRIATTENLALKYQIDLIPLAVINYRKEQLIRVSPTVLDYRRDRETAYAVGVTPVNFQLNFRRRTKIQPFLTAEAGLLIFGKKVPDDRSALRPNQVGRRLNFTLAGGGGVEFLTDDARSYTVGFKFHHISNASTGNINPGFDQNLFYFGYTFRKF